MTSILVFGAGKSSAYLIQYLLHSCQKNDWHLVVCDQNTAHLTERFGVEAHARFINLNIKDEATRQELISVSSIVVSLMPPHLHLLIAQDCVALGKHLITASYVSDEMQALNNAALDNNVMLMCELGLDPGIDHMSAMQLINTLHDKGIKIESFLSHCGGLVAPSSDDNPWRYKISWNPRNVVTAGLAGAEYLEYDKQVHKSYTEIFKAHNTIKIPKLGELGYYPNRDSISYKSQYGLNDVHTLIRTTLRYPKFIEAWQYVILAGLTNTEDDISQIKTIRDWHSKLEISAAPRYIQELLNYLFDDLSDELLIGAKSSADILQKILEIKLAMQPNDKDMIVMQHEFGYYLDGNYHVLKSTLVVQGEDRTYTAMAKTVGLPMAIFAEQLLLGNLKAIPGVHIPIQKEIYEVLLPMLAQNNIIFTEYNEEYPF
jgi:saccharopine dehydrogenase-like NADP-dependent oxidoreductase